MSITNSAKDIRSRKGKVAIVTGGTRGMGRAISKSLLENGIKVCAVYRADTVSAKEAEKELKEVSKEFEIIKADVGQKKDAQKIAAEVGKKWNRIDILVNNAGILDFVFLEEMTEESFDRIIQNNLKSVVFMIQAVIPWMKKNHFGRIVNASSISGTLSDIGLISYACSKAGVNMLTRIASGELAPYGITVNAYAPGIIHTEMTREMIETRGHVQVKQIPAGYFGKSEEVAGLVSFLSSDDASYITGEIVGVDGGMMKVQNPYRAYEYAKGKK
jgi:3-oxoacyl-[acyl-carrier protein] reductase